MTEDRRIPIAIIGSGNTLGIPYVAHAQRRLVR
jgi:hypothetical protein